MSHTIGISIAELVRKILALALRKRFDESQSLYMDQQISASGMFSSEERQGEQTHVLAADGLNHIIWGCTQQLRNDRKLVDMVLSREERLSLQHLGEDAACAPNVDLHVILLPGEHDLGGTVISRGNVTSHLRVLNTSQTEIADLQVAVFINKNVAGLQVSVDHTGGVDIFQSTLEEVQY